MDSFSLKGRVALISGDYDATRAGIVFNDIRQKLVDKGPESYRKAGIQAHGYVRRHRRVRCTGYGSPD